MSYVQVLRGAIYCGNVDSFNFHQSELLIENPSFANRHTFIPPAFATYRDQGASLFHFVHSLALRQYNKMLHSCCGSLLRTVQHLSIPGLDVDRCMKVCVENFPVC